MKAMPRQRRLWLGKGTGIGANNGSGQGSFGYRSGGGRKLCVRNGAVSKTLAEEENNHG